MTIDERIEALTQSLELLSSLHGDLERQTAARFRRFGCRERLTNAMTWLADIAVNHEWRLENPEGSQ